MFRAFFALIALSTLAILVSLGAIRVAASAQDPLPQNNNRPPEPAKPQESPKPVEPKPSDVKFTAEQIAESLRRGDPPIVGMRAEGRFVLDVRTLREPEIGEVIQAFRKLTQ